MVITDALELWADWQQRYRLKLGFPAKSMGIASGGVNCWDDVSDGVDSWICEVIEASVNDLSINHPAQAAAVNHRYCHAVFLFPRNSYADLLGKALDWLAEDLDRRGVYVDKLSEEVIKNSGATGSANKR